MLERIKKIKRIGKEGFTLIEILVAMSILSIGLLGLAGLATNAMKASSNAISITQASNIAQDRLEALLTIDIDNLNTTDLTVGSLLLARTCTQTSVTASRPVWACTPSNTVTLDNREYTWSYSVTHIDLDGNGIAVLSHDALVRIDLTVTWTDQLWASQKSLSTVALRSLD
ncbi:MAG: type IV pilus modification protein PilV [Proteobacteria bacterium]|nr:type IV pilus modification protein PilV [Pseudomonadota bacterium]